MVLFSNCLTCTLTLVCFVLLACNMGNCSSETSVRQELQAWHLEPKHRFFPHTVAEEDGPPTVSMSIDCGPGMGPSAFGSVRGGPRQSSLNAVLDKNKPGKKKPGLFRGIGSMFRYVIQLISNKYEARMEHLC